MIDKNILLARFWANANQFTTADGIEIDLHGDDIVVVSTTLKNTAGSLREIQMMAEFGLDAFIAEMEVQLLDDVMEIDLNMLFAWLIGGILKGSYCKTGRIFFLLFHLSQKNIVVRTKII